MNDYERIARVIRHLDGNGREQPSLSELAEVAGLSEGHFHRLFQRWAGVTPKDFLQCLTAEFAREQLRHSRSVLEAALAAGLSGPGRLHDLMVTLEAATPGEVKSGGAGMAIEHGTVESPFGECFLAWNERGVCYLSFEEPDALARLGEVWPKATLREHPRGAKALRDRIFRDDGGGELRTFVRGSEFQLKVWRALLRIPPGSSASYGRIAEAVGSPRATRAVGTACGSNLVSWLIPCHRVIRETGAIKGYRWGTERKRAMLGWEAARSGNRRR